VQLGQNGPVTRSTTFETSPDRLLPTDPGQRAIARELYALVQKLPIVSPHGHVPIEWIADNRPFRDATELLLTPDHYITRLLHSHGVPLHELGVGVPELSADRSRAAFRILCEHWPAFRGTPMRMWMEDELAGIFDIHHALSADSADAIFDEVTARLAEPDFMPRRLLERFDVEVLATTDDPLDSLEAHAAVAADPQVATRVLPTFRPDELLEPGSARWLSRSESLAESADVDVSSLDGFIEALRRRRAHFAAHGAVSTDHSHADAGAVRLEPAAAEQLYRAARAGTISLTETTALRRHLVFEQARLSTEDGLVMTIHPSIARDYDPATREKYGPNVGADIPLRGEFVHALRPMLNAFGTHPGFRLVAFTTDETTFASELAPLAGFYPSLFVGAPWWFIDTPDAIHRYYSAVSPNAGFGKLSGFIDDTRALCSIPARHDMNRRVTARYFAGLVADHRLSLEDAAAGVVELIQNQPRRVFGL
jgi:glucuronate isomerase